MNVWEHDNEIEFGKLRKDNDGHWYLIPENKVDQFDKKLYEIRKLSLSYSGDSQLYRKLYNEFDDMYDRHIIPGFGHLKVLME